MNRVADIRAAALARVPIGVDVSKLSNKGIDALLNSRLPVLLDSGAFSEVAIRDGRIQIVNAIDIKDWRRRLAIYLRIAKSCARRGSEERLAAVTAIAPDMVGSQEITLERLSRLRPEVRTVQSAGADILVPLQRGLLGLEDFYNKARDVTGIEIVPGFPMKKAATSIHAILIFLERISIGRIHLLGMGANHPDARSVIRLARYVRPNVQITMDANRIRAAIGIRRPITVREQKYRDDSTEGWTGQVDLRAWGGETHDMTEALLTPSIWMSGTKLLAFANSLSWLDEPQRENLLSDPDAFVNADEHLDDWLYQSLMQAYFSFLQEKSRGPARTRAVFEILDDSQIGGQV